MTKDEKIILGITAGSHLSVHSLMVVFPSILLVLKNEFSVGLDTLGFVAAAGTFMFGLGAIPAGYFESKLGGRTLLLIYQLGTIVASLFIIFTKTLWALTIGLMLLGLVSSIYHPAGLTIISRRVRNISKGMAFHGIAGSLGLAFGPVLASVFTEIFSWRMAYGFLVTMNVILALGTISLIPPRKSGLLIEDKARTELTNKPALLIYYAISILMGLSFAGFTTFMPAHFAIETRMLFSSLSDTFRGGLFTTMVLLSGTIGQTMGGYFGSRYRRTDVLFWIVLLNIPFLALMGFTSGILMIFFGIILGIVHFNWQPVANSLIAQITNSQDRGIGYGINFFLSFGVGAFAAGVSGLIAENVAVSFVFPAMALVLIPAIYLTWLLRAKV